MGGIAIALGTLFTSLVAAFAQYVAKRIAIIAAGIIAMTAATTLFTAAIWAIKETIYIAFPGGLVEIFFRSLPSNLDACLAAIGAARLASFVYLWNISTIKYKSWV